jgi:hypothetical protein
MLNGLARVNRKTSPPKTCFRNGLSCKVEKYDIAGVYGMIILSLTSCFNFYLLWLGAVYLGIWAAPFFLSFSICYLVLNFGTLSPIFKIERWAHHLCPGIPRWWADHFISWWAAHFLSKNPKVFSTKADAIHVWATHLFHVSPMI